MYENVIKVKVLCRDQ